MSVIEQLQNVMLCRRRYDDMSRWVGGLYKWWYLDLGPPKNKIIHDLWTTTKFVHSIFNLTVNVNNCL